MLERNATIFKEGEIMRKILILMNLAICTAIAGLGIPQIALAQEETSDHDYRTFVQGKPVAYGQIGDSYTADLVLYLAGNQYMVVEDLMKDFLAKHPEVKTAYVETIPPGQILKEQILKQGQIKGKDTARNPDIYASVDSGHIQVLKKQGLMDEAMIYIHNQLELMIVAGNPKKIKGVRDLGRDDLVQSHPNPITEGIFTFYGIPMLKSLGLYEKVTGGKECRGCWAVPGKTWFTDRHHRDTPDRLEKGQADVGIVWSTEVVEWRSQGRKIDGVKIEAPYNMADKVGYVIGALKTGRNPKYAQAFLTYLATNPAQAIYEKHGFVRASAEELKLKPIEVK